MDEFVKRRFALDFYEVRDYSKGLKMRPLKERHEAVTICNQLTRFNR